MQQWALVQPGRKGGSLEDSGIHQSADRFVGMPVQNLKTWRFSVVSKAIPHRFVDYR
jgi:hypothetical protein